MARPGAKACTGNQEETVALLAVALIGLNEETTGPSHDARQRRLAAEAQQRQVDEQFLAASPLVSSRVRNKRGVTQVMMTSTLYPHLSSLKLQEPGEDPEDCSTPPCPPTVTQPAHVDMFRLVEVANPNYDINGEARIMRVYLPWTVSDCTEACKSLGDPKADPAQWVINHRLLIESDGLNGYVATQTIKKSLGFNWGRVKGSFTGQDHEGRWLTHESMNLPTKLEGVYARIERTWRATRNYTKIAQFKQKDGENIYEYAGRLEEVFKVHGGLAEEAAADSPYQSQLK